MVHHLKTLITGWHIVSRLQRLWRYWTSCLSRCQARMNWRPRWKGEVKSCVRCSHLVEIGLEKKWSRRQLSLLLPARVLRLRLSPKPRASSRKEAAAATNRATGQALQTC